MFGCMLQLGSVFASWSAVTSHPPVAVFKSRLNSCRVPAAETCGRARLHDMAVASSASRGGLPKQTSGSAVSKSKVSTSTKIEATASRNRNTSGGDSGVTGGGRMLIYCDGKNVTPKSLVPSHYQKLAGGDQTNLDSIGILGTSPSALPTHEEEKVVPEKPPPTAAEIKAKAPKQATLSKDELERPIDIVLSETQTETLLTFPSLCVSLDNPQSGSVSSRNKAYEELCASKADSDQYKEQHCQTMNQPHKSKEVFAAAPNTEHAEVNVTGWDIYDAFATAPVPKHEQIQQACEKESQAAVSVAVKKPGCLFTMQEPYPVSELPKEVKQKTGGDGGRRGVRGNAAGASGTLRAGISAGPSALAGGATAETSGYPAAQTEAIPVDTLLPGQDEDAVLKEEPKASDKIPWQVGAENPIPDEMAKSLRVMERIVSQNVFHRQHMIYRNYPTLDELARLDEIRMEEAMGTAGTSGFGDVSVAEDAPVAAEPAPVGAGLEEPEGGEEAGDEIAEDALPEEKDADKPALQDLFCFDAPQLTQGMTVTCAEWNSNNKDLLAVSYGDTAPVPINPGGLVLFWSLKNPTYPERVIRTRHGVTALHFSSIHPNMVAAGTHDGSVMIWDLRRPSDTPVLRSGSSVSSHNDQKHTDIVWETRWVDQGPDKQPPELLVSVSSDGNVLQWSLKKGLEQMLLMPLKRIANPYLGANCVYKHKEGIVFRKSSGFCIDFPRHDPSTYLVGTEDGLVHRCSTSYNEQYLDTYYGHSGPVYRVRCNPFMSHAFLTCSADWTMKLWTTKPPPGHPPETPLLTFQSTDLYASVNDVIWAPQNSTSFAAAMDDGRIELWDLAEKPLDPIVVHYPQEDKPQRRRTCVRFSPNSPVLVAGDDQGSVDVMRMYNTNQAYYSDQEQQDRLSAVMVKKR